MNKNYFKLSEQACKCCGTGRLAPDFLIMLNHARELAGIPFILNSAFRCAKHNIEVGGSDFSSHLVGCAADIRVIDNMQRFIIVKALLDAGINRIGIGKNFIHADNDFTKQQNVVWLY